MDHIGKAGDTENMTSTTKISQSSQAVNDEMSDALTAIFNTRQRIEDGEASAMAMCTPLEEAMELVPLDHPARALLVAAHAANERAMKSWCHERFPEADRAVKALEERVEL